MKQLAFAAALAVATFGYGTATHAMSAPQMSMPSSGIVHVEGGCGPGGHRTPYGRCVSNYRRGCPPGMHFGRYGRCRPNF